MTSPDDLHLDAEDTRQYTQHTMLLPKLTAKESQALRFISNSLTQHAKSPSIREIQRELGYGSPRSAAVILESLIKNRRVERRANGRLKILKDLVDKKSRARTVPIPLLGTAPCGQPLLADENIEAVIPVSVTLAKPPHRYFLLRARGDSMDQAGIRANDLVLVRQQRSAENGTIVVAVIDDEATIKEYKRTKTAVVLKPKSNSAEHQPIILSRDFRIQGVVIRTIADGD